MSAPTRRSMLFIDGGYLRRKLKDLKGDDSFNIEKFQNEVCKQLITERSFLFFYELIRTYYYDCNFDISDETLSDERKIKFVQNKTFFDGLNGMRKVEVKLGHLTNTDPLRQKGVDILIAIDMLSKAYDDHYDIGILVCGDNDFLPLIKAVKDQTGKRVYGAFFKGHCPDELKREFDECLEISRGDFSEFGL